MTKIFTFGSCVSRDIFNHTDSEDFNVSLNIQRMSFALLPLEGYPINYEDIDLDYLDDFPWEVKMMVIEIAKKGLLMAKESDADYVVMDLIEERFDFAEFEIDGKVYRSVKSGHFENFYKKYLKGKTLNYRELSIEDYEDEEIIKMFKRSMDVVIDRFSINRIILLETYFAKDMVDDNGVVVQYEEQKMINKMNVRLRRVYRLMKQVLEGYCSKESGRYALVVAPENNMGYANHKWGPFPVHYTDEFYEDMGNKILRIVERNI